MNADVPAVSVERCIFKGAECQGHVGPGPSCREMAVFAVRRALGARFVTTLLCPAHARAAGYLTEASS